MSVLAAAVAAMLGLAQAEAARASATQPPAEQDGTAVEGVVVQGRRTSEEEQRKAESAFVRELAAPTRRARLARWDDQVCPGVVGWPHDRAAYVVERIAQEARAVGLEVGPPGCEPDILILVTSDGDRTAREVREKFRKLFVHPLARSLYSGGGGQTADQFVAESRPVRWWHLTELTGSDGRPLRMAMLSSLVPGMPEVPVPVVDNAAVSRAASAVKEDLARALIIVDTSRLKGVTYEELASYLAMVSLAQLKPDAEPDSLPTILSLFRDRDAGGTRPDTLTEWDRAYLRGLYAAADNSRSLHTQRGAIRRSLEQVSETAPRE